MPAHHQPGQKRRQAAFGAVLIVLMGWLAWWGQWMDPASFDLPTVLRGQQAVTNAVIVSIDEDSYRILVSSDPNSNRLMDRRHHVSLLHRLREAQAKAVVFDLNFQTPWPVEGVDRELSQAMHQMGNVAIAAHLVDDDQSGVVGIREPIYPIQILATNARVGFAEANRDFGQAVVRRHFTDEKRVSLAWATATMLGKVPGLMKEPRWIHYYGPPFTVPTIPYYQVLDSKEFPAELLARKVEGKVVFVGEGREGSKSDWHLTPHTQRAGRPTSGVEIQATMFLNLWQEDWWRRLPWGIEMALLTTASLLLGAGLTACRPPVALGLALAGAAVVFVGAVVLVWETRWWFSWLTICAVQIPLALGWSVFSYASRLHPSTDLPPQRADSMAPPQTGASATSQDPGSAGPVIPDHTLLHCVGRGGYGEVWLSRNFLGAFHAVKIVRRQRFQGREPYERELRGVKKFMPLSRAHPGWVPILHVGQNEAGEYFYYVMEAADDVTTGTTIRPGAYQPLTLARALEARGPLPLAECRELGLNLTAALEYLHGHHLVHRDIKTSNIVFLRGTPRFVDIGLVTDVAVPGGDTSFVGTEDYLCPEGPGAPAADVYALGKVLYTAMSGLEPAMFPELPTGQAEKAHESGLLELFEVVAKACEANRRQRFQSAQEFHEALRRLRG